MTRITFFELVSDQVVDIAIDDLQNVLDIRKVDGVILFDKQSNNLLVAQSVEQLGDDLYVNDSGKVFSVKGEQDSPEKF